MGSATYHLHPTKVAFDDEVVEILQLSRRYIEDVVVEVRCEGMVRMDKIKTKIYQDLKVKSRILEEWMIIGHSRELSISH